MRVRILLLVTVLAAAIPAAPARPDATVSKAGDTITLTTDQPGERHDVELFVPQDGLGAIIRFRERGDERLRAAGGPCSDGPVRGRTVDCLLGGSDRIVVALLDANDRVEVREQGAQTIAQPVGMSGGDGFDVLRGGLGDDPIDGGPEADQLFGGGGVDTVNYQARGSGFSSTTDPVQVTIGDGQPNDGSLSADGGGSFVRDNVAGDIERVLGSDSVSDDLVGDESNDELFGFAGDDRLEGRLGADLLDGRGDDDVIFARDDAADAAILCGDGDDRVIADPVDTVDASCEDVDRGGAGVTGPGANDPPGGPDDVDEGPGPGGGSAGRIAPEVEILTRLVRLTRRGVAPILVRCVYRAQRCRGTVTLRTTRRLRARVGRRVLALRRGARAGRARVEVPWGTSRPVAVRVRAALRRIAARRRAVPVRVSVAVSDSAAGDAAAQARLSRTITVVGRRPRRGGR
jgi:hypothetical protein